MKAAATKSSRSFWVIGFVILFAVHAVAVFHFGDRPKPAPEWRRPEAFIQFGGDPAIEARLALLTAGRDPTLFALPHPQGFSGGAWLKFQPEVPALSNWSAPPEWLALPVEQLGDTLREYVATNRPASEVLLAALHAVKSPELRLPAEPVLTGTFARVEGSLVARRLVSAPPLPAITHQDVPRPTVVDVLVNGDGVVESVALADTSGVEAADSRAVELARRFEFEPLALREVRTRESAPSALGRIRFTWQVVAPTNAAPATASTR